LELAGLSAGSYVAGRAARKTGPRIDGITATHTAAPAPARIDFVIKGAGLSKNASFRINDVDVAATNVAITKSVQDDSRSDTSMAKSLDVRITDPQGTLPQPLAQPVTKLGAPNAEGHGFVIINPDGQRAVWKS
jgi:hypothetical protein